MNTDSDTTRIVRSWLELGATDLSDRVLDDVLAQLPATPQRRPVWSVRRPRPMHLATKLLAVAAVVAVVAIIGANLLPGGVPPDVGTSPSPSVVPSRTAAPSPSAAAASLALPIAGSIRPGRYHIDIALRSFATSTDTPTSIGPARVSFAMPAGWTSLSGWGVTKHDGFGTDVSMAPFIIDRVYLDPCHSDAAVMTDPALSRSLDGLAEALSAGWLDGARIDATVPVASVPLPTSFAGWPARSVTVESPDDVRVAECDGAAYNLWQDPVGNDRYTSVVGGSDRLVIVEVSGTADPSKTGLLVMDAEAYPDASASDLAELQAIFDSIEIELIER